LISIRDGIFEMDRQVSWVAKGDVVAEARFIAMLFAIAA
jgi:hypothetical protein